jgi:hypothetical protein
VSVGLLFFLNLKGLTETCSIFIFRSLRWFLYARGLLTGLRALSKNSTLTPRQIDTLNSLSRFAEIVERKVESERRKEQTTSVFLR